MLHLIGLIGFDGTFIWIYVNYCSFTQLRVKCLAQRPKSDSLVVL